MVKRPLFAIVAVLALAGVIAAAWFTLSARAPGSAPGAVAPGFDDLAGLDRRHEDIPYVDSASWIDVYLPQLAYNGFTLDLYKRRVPILMDMNGRIVHSWPGVRVVGRARLTPEGRLYVIGIDNRLKEYDWEGNLTWWYELEGEDFPHHDFVRLANGNYLIDARSDADRTDYLLEVDHRRQVVWSWRAADRLEEAFPGWDREAWDPTHINSIHELPPNHWYDEGDTRFRPGNILVSARNLNALFIIDKATGHIVWTFEDGLDYQHEALMIPEGQPAAGCVIYFNNHYHATNGVRSSSIDVIDPVSGVRRWSYDGRYFFSSTAGSQQPLPNGNLLITSSQGGRAFEIRPNGQVVWQWTPPFLPMRAERYAADYCPQFAQLPRAPHERVAPNSKRQFVSIGLTKLAMPEQYDVRELHGARREVLRDQDLCNVLVFPPYSGMVVRYGIDPDRLHGGTVAARFRLSLQPEGETTSTTVVDDTVASTDDDIWREHVVALQHLPYRPVEVCIHTDVLSADPPAAEGAITWQNPDVGSPYRSSHYDRLNPKQMTAQERAVQEEQLRAIGYIQ